MLCTVLMINEALCILFVGQWLLWFISCRMRSEERHKFSIDCRGGLAHCDIRKREETFDCFVNIYYLFVIC